MSNLQPEEFKTHSSVIAIEQKLKGQMSFSFTSVRDSYIKRILSSIKINKATGARRNLSAPIETSWTSNSQFSHEIY